MSQDLRTLELFAEANPVPDEQAIESPRIEATAYLATLPQRSSDVVQLDERTEVKDKKRNWMIAAAAAVIVVLGAVVFILTQSSEEPPVATQPPVETGTIEGYWEQGTTRVAFEGEAYYIIVGDELADTGRYTTIGNELLQLRSLEGTARCEPLDGGAWDYELAGESLSLTFRSDDCDAARGLGVGTLTLTRVDPFAIPEAAASADTQALVGSWTDGTIDLTFAPDGTYEMVVQGEPFDQGTFELLDNGATLELTASPSSTECSSGDTMIISVGFEPSGDLVMNTQTDECSVRDSTLGPPRPFSARETEPVESAADPFDALPIPVLGFGDGGEYRTGSLFAPAAYTIPDGSWERLSEVSEYIWLCKEPDEVGNCQAAVWIFDPMAPTVEVATASLTSRSGPTFSEPEPVDVGGASGVMFDVSSDDGPHILHEFSSAFDQLALHIGEQAIGHVVDVEGEAVAIYLFSTESGNHFQELQTILETIVWRDLQG